MYHEIHTVTEFAIVAPYTLRIVFADGHTQVIDFLPILHGEIFGPLRDHILFNGVTLDEEAGTLVWPNGADFDPGRGSDSLVVFFTLSRGVSTPSCGLCPQNPHEGVLDSSIIVKVSFPSNEPRPIPQLCTIGIGWDRR